MKVSEITTKHVIHVESESEFNRIIDLFNIDKEYFDFDFYKEDTVLYPLTNQYGDINGYCVEENYIVIKSELVS